ncbi:hypothetical protein RLOatenuis_4240 [Rickettsiales bacterium]|nr:hypothetical protein RLOatenuis_4240 [Rickettsiales bacterium]
MSADQMPQGPNMAAIKSQHDAAEANKTEEAILEVLFKMSSMKGAPSVDSMFEACGAFMKSGDAMLQAVATVTGNVPLAVGGFDKLEGLLNSVDIQAPGADEIGKIGAGLVEHSGGMIGMKEDLDLATLGGLSPDFQGPSSGRDISHGQSGSMEVH